MTVRELREPGGRVAGWDLLAPARRVRRFFRWLGAPGPRRVRWSWSSRDEHLQLSLLLGGIVAFGLLLRWVPRRFDLVHAFEHRVGLMAPTCGLTRAGLSLLRCAASAAWRYNPAVFVVAVVPAMLIARVVVGASSGRWLSLRVQVGRPERVGFVLAAVALWVNQQAHFSVLAK